MDQIYGCVFLMPGVKVSMKEYHTPRQCIVVVDNEAQIDLALRQLCNRRLALQRKLLLAIASLPLLAGILNLEPGSSGLRMLY